MLCYSFTQISNQDKLPHQICNVCHRSIQFASTFRKECQKVDVFLRSYRDENEASIGGSILNYEGGLEGRRHPDSEKIDINKYRVTEEVTCPVCKKNIKRSLLVLHAKTEHPRVFNAHRSQVLREKKRDVIIGKPNKQTLGDHSAKVVNEPRKDDIEFHSPKQKHYFSCQLCPLVCF